MANAEKLLRGLLGKAYKMPSTEIDTLLSDQTTDEDGETQIIDGDRTRIGKLTTPKKGETFQDGYKKAKAEVLTALETKLKEKHGYEGDEEGDELIEAIITSKGAGKGAKLTDDQIKAHPIYQDALKESKKALKALEDGHAAKITELENGIKRGNTLQTVQGKAKEILTGMNPVLPGNEKVASNQMAAFLKTFEGYDYDIQDGGNRVLLMKDGKLVEDGHGNSVDFEKFVKDQGGNWFEFAANNGGSNGGNGKPGDKDKKDGAGGGGKKKYPDGVVAPKNEDEYITLISDRNRSLADRTAIEEAWTEQNTPAK